MSEDFYVDVFAKYVDKQSENFDLLSKIRERESMLRKAPSNKLALHKMNSDGDDDNSGFVIGDSPVSSESTTPLAKSKTAGGFNFGGQSSKESSAKKFEKNKTPSIASSQDLSKQEVIEEPVSEFTEETEPSQDTKSEEETEPQENEIEEKDVEAEVVEYVNKEKLPENETETIEQPETPEEQPDEPTEPETKPEVVETPVEEPVEEPKEEQVEEKVDEEEPEPIITPASSPEKQDKVDAEAEDEDESSEEASSDDDEDEEDMDDYLKKLEEAA